MRSVMPRSGVAFVHRRSFEESGSRGRYGRRPGSFSALANAIVARHNLRSIFAHAVSGDFACDLEPLRNLVVGEGGLRTGEDVLARAARRILCILADHTPNLPYALRCFAQRRAQCQGYDFGYVLVPRDGGDFFLAEGAPREGSLVVKYLPSGIWLQVVPLAGPYEPRRRGRRSV